MKTYSFNVGVDVWIKGVEIEANSEEEAREQFNNMSLEELMQNGCVKSEEFYDVDAELLDSDDDDDYEELTDEELAEIDDLCDDEEDED